MHIFSKYLLLSSISALSLAHAECNCSCHHKAQDTQAKKIDNIESQRKPIGSGENSNKQNFYKVNKQKSNDDFKTGFRYGLGIGGERTKTDTLGDHANLAPGVNFHGDLNDNKITFDFIPHIEIGYQFKNRFYLGVLAIYHYSPNHQYAFALMGPGNNTANEIKFNRQFSFSSLLKIGYKATNHLMLYGLAGISYTRWKEINQMFINGALHSADHDTESAVGVKLGGGIEWQLNSHFALSADWTHTSYRNRDDDTIMSQFGERHSIHSFAFKITYYF